MSFHVASSTLQSLEWTRLVARLAARCRTPQGLAHLEQDEARGLFESEIEGVRSRLRETSEARSLHDRGEAPELAGCTALATLLARAEKGGLLEPTELADVEATLRAIVAAKRFFDGRGEHCPALAELAAPLTTCPALATRLARAFDPSGELRDEASPTLARARRDQARLAGELEQRIGRLLRQGELAPHLSDAYSTVRSGRYVVPVRAEARGHVRGIVHDASRTGTTLFVEPEAMIELNNLHREAELAVERETMRVLRELSGAVALEARTIAADLAAIGRLDLALARGALSRELDACEPRVAREGVLELPGLRHPLIAPERCVANDLELGARFSVLILSGPNAGGKTVAMKAMALAALMVRAGLHVPAEPSARVDLFDAVIAEVGDHQDLAENLSTFSAAMARLADVLTSAGPHTLVCLDEVGVGTDPSEGASLAQAALEDLAERGARVVTTTHYNLLKELAQLDPRFANASVEFDPLTFAPTYRVRIGSPGASSAATVAARMGIPARVLERADALLDREDRRLDRMLSELAAARATLANEEAAARAARLESESAREEYRGKLARLQTRRDELFARLRGELEQAFRGAHDEVARIVAQLQREPSSRSAADAREQLVSLRAESERIEVESELATDSALPAPSAPLRPIDWPRARVGDGVRTLQGITGTLASLPDRRGRVGVQTAGAKLVLPREQLGRLEEPTPRTLGSVSSSAGASRTSSESRPSRSPAAPLREGGVAELDLRGLRADEAIDRLEAELDQAAAIGRDELRVIHGIGTGALRRVVREVLPRSVWVVEMLEASRDEGGAGVTRAVLRKD